MPKLRLLLATTLFAMLDACALHFSAYVPEATWGTMGHVGGCPTGAPSIVLVPTDLPWFRIDIGLWDELNARNRGLNEPTLFFRFLKPEPFGGLGRNSRTYQDQKATPVYVRASAPAVKVMLPEGSTHRFDVPEFASDLAFVGENTGQIIQVPLKGLSPQTLVIELPQLTINDKKLEMGSAKFRYERKTQIGGC